MSDTMNKALNIQINNELYAAYLYLGMSSYFKSHNLPGFAKWMQTHAQEEIGHAMKIHNFVLNNKNWHLKLLPIKAPENTWNSSIEVFNMAYEHEQIITQTINNLVKLAIDTNDYATHIFLQWFVTEQLEEEATFSELLEKVKLAGDSSAALLFLDVELGKGT
jgi:ferritin